MKNVSVVIGLGYGDEGKGMTTDYLANRSDNVAVARFSGGANAGHTVELADGTRHVFRHLGSGSLSGAHTILTRDFVVNPILFWKEAEELAEKVDMIPHVYIDPECLVTTPYDVYLNQESELLRRESGTPHGSTGVGLGETVHREESGYSLRIKDFFERPSELRERIEKIRDEYFWKRLSEIGGDPDSSSLWVLDGVDAVLMDSLHDMLHQVTVIPDYEAMEAFDHVIFEGSQGLYLDQNSRDFPHVTRANTGLCNVAPYLSEEHQISVYYVTRTHLTRHGAGELENELEEVGHEADKTNFTNEWQGELRYAPLDFRRMREEVADDLSLLGDLDKRVVAVVTWGKYIGELTANVAEHTVVATGADAVLISYGKTRESFR